MSQHTKLYAVFFGFAVALTGACEPPDASSPMPPAMIAVKPEVETKTYSLPVALRVDDDSVNVFVEQAMDSVASGEYEPFRLLWSVKDEPVSRTDYQQRWKGVTDIRVHALHRIILTDVAGTPTGIETYALLADFPHDPSSSWEQRKPLRDVVWLVVKEQDQWRLAKPPRAVKRWLREQTGDTS